MGDYVVLGGSKAEGRATPLSDIDLFVVSEQFDESKFVSSYRHLGDKIDVERLSPKRLEEHLTNISNFEINIAGLPPTVPHSVLRFLCRCHLGEILVSDVATETAMSETRHSLRLATTSAAAAHYFSLLEDMASWAMVEHREEFLINAFDLFQRACMVFALQRQLVDPNLKWAWFLARQVSSGAERDMIGRVFHIIDHIRVGQIPLERFLSFTDAIICMGRVGLQEHGSKASQGDTDSRRIFVKGVPELMVGYHIETKAPYVLSKADLEMRVQQIDKATTAL